MRCGCGWARWPGVAAVRSNRDRPIQLSGDRLFQLGTAFLLAAIYLGIHLAKWPDFSGWWVGFDQSQYLEAARAWAHGDLRPGSHHYLPGYALLAAPFVWLFPAQPFVVVDLVCLLLTFGLFVALCRRLGGGVVIACAGFLLATLSSRAALAVWVVPWTTTPAAPAILGALLAALGRRAFVACLAAALVAWFRPADSVVILALVGGYGLCSRASVWAMLAGVLVAWLPLVAVHWLIFGPTLGAYLTLSAGIGFEWRLIPMRWVTLVLDPRPLFAGGPGMALAFPWIVPGLAGLLAGMLGRKAPHVLVGAAIVASWLLYLAYRDLQVPNLWRFYNFHYFKWTQPFLAFYALTWLWALLRGPRRRAVGAGVAVALLLPWRAEMQAASTAPARIDGGRLTIPTGLAHLDAIALLGPVSGWRDEQIGQFGLEIGGQRFVDVMALAAYSEPDGILLFPLRTLPPGPAIVSLDPRVDVATGAVLTVGRQRIRLGW